MLHRILLVAAALTLLPRASAAQGSLQDVPAERLRPAIDRNGIIDVESGSVGSHLDFDAALWLGYALNPLVLYQDTGDGDERVGALVQHRLGANFVGALSLVDWLQIGIDLPVVLYQGADQDAVDLLGDTAPDAAGFGDLRLVPKVRLLHAAQHGINLALMPIVTLPTGFPGANHLGEESFTASPELAASRHFGPLRAGLNVGYRWREKTRLLSLRLDDEITYRIGAAIDLEPWAKVPAQAAASIGGGLSARAPFEHQNRSPLEMLLSGLWEVTEDLQVFVGTGFGLVSGYATPDLRLFGGVRFSPRTFDRDGDGIPDELDACSTRAEDKDGYNDEDGCPDPDNDGDGLLDEADSCPTRAEDIDSFEDDDGCPDEDNDADGIADENDDCPMAAEDEDGFEDDDGCPEADNDADGIEDAEDQCPLEAEDKDGFEDEDGCPDPDNDRDGIEDERDQCPNEAEVINGVEGQGDRDSD